MDTNSVGQAKGAREGRGGQWKKAAKVLKGIIVYIEKSSAVEKEVMHTVKRLKEWLQIALN
jgi:hypothetical protein